MFFEYSTGNDIAKYPNSVTNNFVNQTISNKKKCGQRKTFSRRFGERLQCLLISSQPGFTLNTISRGLPGVSPNPPPK